MARFGVQTGEVPFISLTWKRVISRLIVIMTPSRLPSRSSRPSRRICPRKPTRAFSIRSSQRSPLTSRPRRRPRRRGKNPPRTTTTSMLFGATSSPSPSPCSPSSRTWARRAPLDLVAVIALLQPLLWNLRHRLTYIVSTLGPAGLTSYQIILRREVHYA